MDEEWVAGKNAAGKVGFFPALYVELLIEATPEQITLADNHPVEEETKKEISTATIDSLDLGTLAHPPSPPPPPPLPPPIP